MPRHGMIRYDTIRCNTRATEKYEHGRNPLAGKDAALFVSLSCVLLEQAEQVRNSGIPRQNSLDTT